MKSIPIRTDDGTCPAHTFQPEGSGGWPAVLVYMDGIGIRPALFELCQRIADAGYFVLLPDLFYRAGPYESPDPKTLFSDPAIRAAWSTKFMSTTNPANVMRDTRAFLAYLDAQPEKATPRIGTTGYCMGGAFSLIAAGTYPDRVAAAASFHGANLASDQPTSPHLLAPQMTAEIYVAGAIEDASFPDAMKQRLDDALTAGGVTHTVETYPARHGWVPRDTPSYDAEQSERHFRELLGLFTRTLR